MKESLELVVIYQIIVAVLIGGFIVWLKRWLFERSRKRRQEYYRNYLKSDSWKRKRFVVLRRDDWRCVYCGKQASQVHHKKYAKYNIGKEPIEWLVSVCKSCHNSLHQ